MSLSQIPSGFNVVRTGQVGHDLNGTLLRQPRHLVHRARQVHQVFRRGAVQHHEVALRVELLGLVAQSLAAVVNQSHRLVLSQKGVLLSLQFLVRVSVSLQLLSEEHAFLLRQLKSVLLLQLLDFELILQLRRLPLVLA